MKYEEIVCKGLEKEGYILTFDDTIDPDGSYILTIKFANGDTKKEEYHDLESFEKRKAELNNIEELQTEYIMEHHEFKDKNVLFAGVSGVAGLVGTAASVSIVNGGPEGASVGLTSGALIVGAVAGKMHKQKSVEDDAKKNSYFISLKEFVNDVIKNNPEIILELIRNYELSRGAIKGFRDCIAENKELTINDIEKFRESDFYKLVTITFDKCVETLRPLFEDKDFADYLNDRINARPLNYLSKSAYDVIETKNTKGEPLEYSDIKFFTPNDLIYLQKLAKEVKIKYEALKKDKGIAMVPKRKKKKHRE